MTLETFFEKFDLFADAPNTAVKMRELVLHLAFSGKLLPTSERWTLRPLKSLASKIGSGATPSGGRESYFTSGIPLIRSMNVHFSGFNTKGLVFLSDGQAVQLSNVTVQHNDVLLNLTGASIGRVTTAPPEMAGARVNQHVAIIRPIKELDAQFLAKFLASPAIQKLINEVQVGATREALTKAMIEQFQIPLPHLIEQKRIVAKVDELMALCDRLASQQEEREVRQATLARASLARFAEKPTLLNLQVLFNPAYSISSLEIRKLILSLAVQGKLIEQDPSAESAHNLLSRIKKIKKYLINERKIKKQETDPIHKNDVPHSIPESWVWTRLGEIGDWGAGSTPPRGNNELYNGDITWLKSGELNDNQSLVGSEETVTEFALKTCTFRRNQPGDVLLAMYGATIGKVAILAKPAVSNQAVCGCTPFEGVSNRYLFNYLISQRDQFHAASEGGAQPNISKVKIVGFPIPLPPLTEQHRIVAKVEELMAIVDTLESQLATAKKSAEFLLTAAVAELTTQVSCPSSTPSGRSAPATRPPAPGKTQ